MRAMHLLALAVLLAAAPASAQRDGARCPVPEECEAGPRRVHPPELVANFGEGDLWLLASCRTASDPFFLAAVANRAKLDPALVRDIEQLSEPWLRDWLELGARALAPYDDLRDALARPTPDLADVHEHAESAARVHAEVQERTLELVVTVKRMLRPQERTAVLHQLLAERSVDADATGSCWQWLRTLRHGGA